MGNAFDGIRLAMSEVIHRVDHPIRTRPVVFDEFDAVDDRITQQHVIVGHVYPRAQHPTSFRVRSFLHFFKQPLVLLNGAIAKWTGCSGNSRRALLSGHLLGWLIVYIRLALSNQLLCKGIKLSEIITGVIFPSLPFEAEPSNIPSNRIHILDTLLLWVGIVESQIGDASVFSSQTETDTDGLGMPNVEVSVGLWRESCQDAALIFPAREIRLNFLLDEVQWLLRCVPFFDLLI